MTAKFRKTSIMSAADGLQIGVMTCEPEEGARGVVQLVHGMCEHKERYAGFMEFLAGKGFVSVIHDHRGHGESVGTAADLGHFMEGGWSGLVEDVRKVTQLAQREYPELPVVLFGHSMGSLAVRACVRRSDEGYAGLVVCGSPSLNSGVGAAKVLGKAFAAVAGDRHRPALLENLTFGSFNRRFRGEKSPHAWICTDPEVVRRYDADPLCNFRFTLNGFIGLFSLMQSAYDVRGWRPGNPRMPVLFMSGEEDPCMISRRKFLEAAETMRKVGYMDVETVLYPGMRHEILNEKGKEKVWNDIAGFLETGMKHIEVVAAVIREGKRILATQRGYGDFKDMWEFPGGKMEAGEEREQALRREIMEELEAEIDIEDFLCTVEYDYPAFHLMMHCYLCTVKAGNLVLKEHESARWLSADELYGVEWLPADIEVIRKLENILRAL